jgi:hypothetical protein
MTSPAPALPPTADGEPPRAAALDLLTVLPTDRWITTGQVAEAALKAGLPITVSDDGTSVLVDGKDLAWLLRKLRRHGWAVYNRHVDPPAWKRTPTGSTAAQFARCNQTGGNGVVVSERASRTPRRR